jgi:hypothetical protein
MVIPVRKVEVKPRRSKGDSTMTSSSIRWKSLAAAVALALAPTPSSAGVVDGVKTVDDVTIYLGVVPAAIVRGHKAELDAAVRSGLPRSSAHNVHIVVAVFNKASGARLENIQVRARIQEVSAPHGRRPRSRTLPLQPMRVNGVLTFGAFTNLGSGQDATFMIDVIRPSRAPRHRMTTAGFEYSHD